MSTTVILADPGPAVAATDVDWAIINTLKTWYPTWLAITGAERAAILKPPDGASYANALDNDEWLDHWVPAVLVTTAKTHDRPIRHADGTIEVAWESVISVIVRGTKPSETRDRASNYEVALRRCLGHRNVIANAGGIIHSARWQNSEIAPVANISRQGRYLAAGMTTFNLITDAALKDINGPQAPLASGAPVPEYVGTVPITEIDITNGDSTVVVNAQDHGG